MDFDEYLKKDKYGLYIHARNYEECVKSIEDNKQQLNTKYR